MNQPGITVADLQSGANSLTKRWADVKTYEQEVQVDSVLSGLNAEDVATKIAKTCGAVNIESFEDGSVSGKIFSNGAKEVHVMTSEALSEKSTASERSQRLQSLCKQEARCTYVLAKD